MDWTTKISKLTSWFVFSVAMIAFILSYNALQQVAAQNGIPGLLSYLWPILIDVSLVVFSLAVVRASLMAEKTVWPWLLVGFFTLCTIGFNVTHAYNFVPGSGLRWIVAVVPPVALFLSFESLMGMIASSVKRTEATDSISQLTAQQATLQNELGQMERHLGQEQDKLIKASDRRKDTIRQLDDTIKTRQAELTQLERHPVVILGAEIDTPDQRRDILRQLVDIQEQDSRVNLTQQDMAYALGVSEKTLQRDLKAISVNGNS